MKVVLAKLCRILAVASDSYGRPKQATIWWRRAAELGDPNSQSDFGTRLVEGKGTKMDLGEAITWFQKAADAGSTFAQANLGWLHYDGLGDFQGSCRVNQSRCFSFLFAIDLTFRVEPHRVRQRPVTDLS